MRGIAAAGRTAVADLKQRQILFVVDLPGRQQPAALRSSSVAAITRNAVVSSSSSCEPISRV